MFQTVHGLLILGDRGLEDDQGFFHGALQTAVVFQRRIQGQTRQHQIGHCRLNLPGTGPAASPRLRLHIGAVAGDRIGHGLTPVVVDRAGIGFVEFGVKQEAVGLGVVGDQTLGHIHINVMEQVGAAILLHKGLARANIVSVGRAIQFDQLVGIGLFLLLDRGTRRLQTVLLLPQKLGGRLGVGKGRDRILEGRRRTAVNLLEMRHTRIHLSGRNIEGERPAGQSERIEPAFRITQRLLHGTRLGDQLRQLRDRSAVDFLNPFVRRIGIHRGQHGVARHPVEIGTLPPADRPIIHAPPPGNATHDLAILQVRPRAGGRARVGLAVGQVDDLAGGARQRDRASRKLAFVEIIHRDRLAQHRHGFHARLPGKIRIGQECIITAERGQVVAVGVAMTLRVKQRRIRRADHAIAIHVLDIIIEGINRLTRVDAASIIPHQPIIDWVHFRAGLERVVAAAQEGQLFVEHGSELAFERKEGGADIAVGPAAVRREGNGGVGRIRVSLVADDHIEVGEVAGGEEQGIVGRPVIDRRGAFDAEHFAAAQNRFVDFNEPHFIDIGEIEGDVALPAPARLLHQTHIGVDRIAKEVRHPLLEGIDARESPFDPALRQLRLHPLRPAAVGHISRIARLPCAHAHREIIVRQRQQAVALDHVLAFAPDAPGQLAIRLARTGRHRDPTRAVFGLHLTLEAHINGRGRVPIGVRIELDGNDVFRRPQNRRRDFVDQPQRRIGGARRGDRRRIGATRTVDHRDLRLVDIDIGTIAAAQLQTQIGAQRNRRDIEFLAKHRLGQRRTMRGEILRVPHGNRDRGGRLHCARIGRGLRGDGGGRLRHPQSLVAGRRLVVTLPARDIAEEHGASIGKEFGRRAIDRRRIHPLEIVAFGLPRKIGRVPQRQFFIQGIGRLNDLKLPAVERWHHPENIDRHRFVHRSKRAAVAHGHHHIAHAAAHGANRIGIDGSVIVRDRCQGVRGNHRVFRGIHDVGAPLGFVLLEGLHQRGEPVNRGRPFRLVGIAGVDQVLQRREIVRAEAVEQQVIFAEGRLLKFTLQDERAECARVGVEIETLAEVRRQAREVGLTQIHIGGGAGGDLGQPAGGQGVGLGASRIEQGHAGERTGCIEGD